MDRRLSPGDRLCYVLFALMLVAMLCTEVR